MTKLQIIFKIKPYIPEELTKATINKYIRKYGGLDEISADV